MIGQFWIPIMNLEKNRYIQFLLKTLMNETKIQVCWPIIQVWLIPGFQVYLLYIPSIAAISQYSWLLGILFYIPGFQVYLLYIPIIGATLQYSWLLGILILYSWLPGILIIFLDSR